jgi:hypothetical protein
MTGNNAMHTLNENQPFPQCQLRLVPKGWEMGSIKVTSKEVI